jgi:hypothetical protein
MMKRAPFAQGFRSGFLSLLQYKMRVPHPDR